jgi:hypothetical protein
MGWFGAFFPGLRLPSTFSILGRLEVVLIVERGRAYWTGVFLDNISGNDTEDKTRVYQEIKILRLCDLILSMVLNAPSAENMSAFLNTDSNRICSHITANVAVIELFRVHVELLDNLSLFLLNPLRNFFWALATYLKL